jgi:hypothetical protein
MRVQEAGKMSDGRRKHREYEAGVYVGLEGSRERVKREGNVGRMKRVLHAG